MSASVVTPQYRSFWPDFVEYMNQRKAFPSLPKAGVWFRANSSGLKDSDYVAMKRGELASDKNVFGVITMIMSARPGDANYHCRLALSEYLSFKGYVLDAAREAAHQRDEIVGIACDPPLTDTDFFQIGPNAFVEVLRQSGLPGRFMNLCGNDDVIREAVRWMHVDEGRQIKKKPALAIEDAIATAERAWATPLEEVVARAGVWNAVSRGSVVLSMDYRGLPCGMSIVLPVTDACYQSVRRGERKPHDVDADDLATASPNVILYASGCRPADMGGLRRGSSLSLFLTMIAQIGYLSRSDLLPKSVPLRHLCFASFPVGIARLRAGGFKPVGATIPGTKIELSEKCVVGNALASFDPIYRAVYDLFAESMNPEALKEWS